ncbi:hypothetical protein BU15DRAFT_60006 [Melanogaster broomeanus]|nr:hypothetical protein BU15DRAFT_60006 [Melanogaster broomeanus]
MALLWPEKRYPARAFNSSTMNREALCALSCMQSSAVLLVGSIIYRACDRRRIPVWLARNRDGEVDAGQGLRWQLMPTFTPGGAHWQRHWQHGNTDAERDRPLLGKKQVTAEKPCAEVGYPKKLEPAVREQI